ncbi:uncharacterized protein F4807DRAFT_468712 [Annulohypoxylon truncatum]|uniref:uncharacterized protein n=1 Tax=Annulohypoxylon truncatum TaxID=327061 RepID=UPI002008A25C|nr:uncharacterized protein F4807DRAFT_468712 [Annulohypoxylon truncatum]KAI1208485.1 hypothetical protein F4807DRAFT_468712 [Annulohypoxylon truncatum]
MKYEYTPNRERPRRVSISSLPKLTRAGTFEIEFSYAVSKLRYRTKKVIKILKKIGKPIGKVLKYIIFAPFLPCTLFFILFDKIMVAAQGELDEFFDYNEPSYPASVYEVDMEEYHKYYDWEGYLD